MQVLNEFGNVFNIHAHSFLIDANVANSPSMKAFKTALSDFKTEIVDVRSFWIIPYVSFLRKKLKYFFFLLSICRDNNFAASKSNLPMPIFSEVPLISRSLAFKTDCIAKYLPGLKLMTIAFSKLDPEATQETEKLSLSLFP